MDDHSKTLWTAVHRTPQKDYWFWRLFLRGYHVSYPTNRVSKDYHHRIDISILERQEKGLKWQHAKIGCRSSTFYRKGYVQKPEEPGRWEVLLVKSLGKLQLLHIRSLPIPKVLSKSLHAKGLLCALESLGCIFLRTFAPATIYIIFQRNERNKLLLTKGTEW